MSLPPTQIFAIYMGNLYRCVGMATELSVREALGLPLLDENCDAETTATWLPPLAPEAKNWKAVPLTSQVLAMMMAEDVPGIGYKGKGKGKAKASKLEVRFFLL